MRTSVCWTNWQGQGLERCTLVQDDEHLILEGVVSGTRGGKYGAYYSVRADAQCRTREVLVKYIGGQTLHVVADGDGHWHDILGDRPVPSLDGCFDVDIGVTPATNTLAIKRLGLAPKARQDIVAAYVPLPSQIEGAFLPVPAQQRYTCLIADRRYRYEGLFRSFKAELELDRFGLVMNYPDTFRRMAENG
ncbi:putative glycolipid-binding domain-containing protein [Thalassospira lucentensis]|uniref:putative glycolipid-binding domain-containing protein n=1 Tax=Thalassospira lucentensis TaxID=168935 RepID=UPI003D2A960B